jgi:hypothetical protein
MYAVAASLKQEPAKSGCYVNRCRRCNSSFANLFGEREACCLRRPRVRTSGGNEQRPETRARYSVQIPLPAAWFTHKTAGTIYFSYCPSRL